MVGLARSDASAAALAKAGAEVRRGTLDDLDGLREAAAASDGVIHLAFKHDIAFSGDFQGAADADRRAVEVLGEALAGSGRPFVVASGTPRALGRVATEEDRHISAPAAAAERGPETRSATGELALSLASRGIRSSLVRLPINHGEGDPGFLATLVGTARAKGVSAYIGEGTNRWPAVHRLDSAHLFRLALEKAPRGVGAAQRGGRGRTDPRHRRGDRPSPQPSGGIRLPRGRARTLQLARGLPRSRLPGLQHTDPRASGVGAHAAAADGRSGEGHHFREPAA
ncbi:NAD-dependent epimerase/dehydratase family protein [Streptomyces violascens]|uniref:NAD-dependent epimerase/dehydratase family protein n=1 Tax=Streptomyces violascens TaxID=67381 RepID=UPI0036510056